MRIEKVTVENFKLFEDSSFSFHPSFNLIVGENGSGKTSLLNLLAICMSAWREDIGHPFDVITPDEDFLNPNNIRGLRKVTRDDLHCNLREESGEIREELSNYLRIESEWNGIPLPSGEYANSRWSGFYATGSLHPGKKGKIGFDGSTFSDLAQQNLDFFMPLLAFYSCNRLWSPSNDDYAESRLRQSMEATFHRHSGYFDWDRPYADEQELRKWLLKLDIIAYQEKQVPLGLRVLQTALEGCLDKFGQLRFMAKEGQLAIFFSDGRRLLFKQLSDGQRTLFAMIGDMVRRAVLLNPQLGDKVLEETPGVVLIDELDLHLHPKWQRRIIEDLRRTFPKIQFICTTHSPFLIQSLRSGEELIMLDGYPTAELGNKGIEEIAHSLMGIERPDVSQRYESMKQAARSYLEMLEQASLTPEEKLAAFKERLADAIAPYADNPAFQAFLEMKRAAKLGE